MADKSLIEWTDATWNPITGCTLVDDGCRHCYAAHLITSWPAIGNHPSRKGLARKNAAGESKFTGEVRFNEQWLDQPMRWRKPRRIFVCAHGDLFHPSVPDEWIDRVFAVMALAPQHTFQVLTKRPERARAYLADGREFSIGQEAYCIATTDAQRANLDAFGAEDDPNIMPQNWPLPNVWIGTSVSDQASADLRIPELLACPAAVRFVSAEPLLGPVNLCVTAADGRDISSLIGVWSGGPEDDPDEFEEACGRTGKIDWVIVGGESGPHARPMHPDWARSLRDQCVAAGVPFLFKQWGEWTSGLQMCGVTGIASAPASPGHFAHPDRRRIHGGPHDGQCFAGHPDHHDLVRLGKRAAGRKLDGGEWSQFPGQPLSPTVVADSMAVDAGSKGDAP